VNILAGDIGGTKTWLQLAEIASESSENEKSSIKDRITILFEQRFVSQQYTSFDDLLNEFLHSIQLQDFSLPEQACIGVAGPVAVDVAGNEEAKVTNLPWHLDARQLAKKFHFKQVRLINDFQAVAFGLAALTDDEVVVLQKGQQSSVGQRTVRAVIGAGTGLGQALLVDLPVRGRQFSEVIPSEGGHADFAARGIEQQNLVAFLLQKQTRVCVEDLLSGRGLVNIYEYLANKHPDKVSEALTEAMKTGDAAAAVGEAALAGEDFLARQAVDLFVAVYGTQAGNYALSSMATGGVYIAGGVAARIYKIFNKEIFLAAFCDKGPMQELMQSIPVMLVLNQQVGLKGAALVASRL
jgi:glucokinase